MVRHTPVGKALGQVDIFVRSLGQANHWSDEPPIHEEETSFGQV